MQVEVTAPVMNLSTWFCIISNLFQVADVVAISASQPYVAFGIGLELSPLLFARLFRTLSFSLLF